MKRTPIHTVLVAAVLFAGFTLAGCTSKISDEQLAKLRELRQQEQTLNQQLQAKEDERNRLRNEIVQRKSELSKCTSNKKFVQEKLQQWPNVWPK